MSKCDCGRRILGDCQFASEPEHASQFFRQELKILLPPMYMRFRCVVVQKEWDGHGQPMGNLNATF